MISGAIFGRIRFQTMRFGLRPRHNSTALIVWQQEADRLHSFNDLIYAFALGDELFVSPVSLQEGDAVLDIGYRDGHWIDALTTKYPWAQIHGIDVLGFKPNDGRLTNPNVNLHTPVDFDGEAWGIAYSSISLARIALQCGNVRDWFSLYDRAKRYLRPGGYLELIEYVIDGVTKPVRIHEVMFFAY